MSDFRDSVRIIQSSGLPRTERIKRLARFLVHTEQEHNRELRMSPSTTPGLYHFMADSLLQLFDAVVANTPASNESNASDASNADNERRS